MNRQRCRLVTTVLVPQRTMKRAWAISSGITPMLVPRVAKAPADPVWAQTARISLVAPIRLKKRRSMLEPWIKPWVPM